MSKRWLFLCLILGGILLLLAGCTTRTADTPAPGVPAGPPAPTQAAPTALPPEPTPPPAGTADPDPSAPTALIAPQLTVQGTMANGISYGITADGQSFKGDPDAPLIMFEFSDYQ